MNSLGLLTSDFAKQNEVIDLLCAILRCFPACLRQQSNNVRAQPQCAHVTMMISFFFIYRSALLAEAWDWTPE
jgi:hypothetical protein